MNKSRPWGSVARPLCAAIVPLMLLTGCRDAVVSATQIARPIAWVEVEPIGAEVVRTVPAVIRSKARADLAFQVPGRVASVNVRVGDRVESTAVLASLDQETYRLSLKQRQAELAQANAGLAEAQAEFARDADLIRDGAVSQTEYERSQARQDTARGSVALLSAAVGLAEESLRFTQLRAPYAGEITARNVEPAQQVQVGQTVLGIQVDSVLEASMTVSEDWINRLRPGGRHTMTLRSLPGVVINGRLTEIGRDARVNNAYPVTLELEDPPDSVRSGMSAEVTLKATPTGREGKSVRIPLTAFTSGPNQEKYVFVFDEPTGTVTRLAVELGEVLEDGIAVRSGLEPGERIAAKGLPFLTDGQRVTLLDVGPGRYLE